MFQRKNKRNNKPKRKRKNKKPSNKKKKAKKQRNKDKKTITNLLLKKDFKSLKEK